MSAKQSVINNSHLSDDELEQFRKKLKKEEESAEREKELLEERLNSLNSASEESQSAGAHHQGDAGTIEANKKRTLAAIERQLEKLDKITVALDRIGTGNYGICVESGQPIQKERLEAIPYAIRAVGMK
jgi:DnaK suppressor protein